MSLICKDLSLPLRVRARPRLRASKRDLSELDGPTPCNAPCTFAGGKRRAKVGITGIPSGTPNPTSIYVHICVSPRRKPVTRRRWLSCCRAATLIPKPIPEPCLRTLPIAFITITRNETANVPVPNPLPPRTPPISEASAASKMRDPTPPKSEPCRRTRKAQRRTKRVPRSAGVG